MRRVELVVVLFVTRIVVGDLSYRQLALIEKLTKQALKIALRESAVNQTGRFEQTITEFEEPAHEGHWELLLGSLPSTILLGVVVPRTESVCLLNFMYQVETDFKELTSLLEQLYHPIYRDILYARNYYDIFFFDLRGNLIYSVYKELDYATNFLANGTGEWKDSGLGEATLRYCYLELR
eukprot:s3683_g4.t1